MNQPKKTSSLPVKIIVGVVVFGFLAVVIPNFIRAKNTSARNACVNNLRQIAGAKEQWALENKKDPADIPTSEGIAVYLRNNHFPVCPEGGKYSIGRVGENPTCSLGISDHSFFANGSYRSHMLPPP